MDNGKFTLGTIVGGISFALSMIMGLLGDMRLETMLIRSFVCFAISIVFCFIVIVSIEKFSNLDKPLQNEENREKMENEGSKKTESKTL